MANVNQNFGLGIGQSVEFYDTVALSAALNYKAFNRNPAAGNLANYQGVPFPYKTVKLWQFRAYLDLTLITDAIRKVLMAASVTIFKNSIELYRGSLYRALGLTGYAAPLDTTIKPYMNYQGAIKLDRPIDFGPNDALSINIAFDATTGVSSAVMVWAAIGQTTQGISTNN